MDLGIRGRSAYVAHANDGFGRAVANALVAEGVKLTNTAEKADIVVAHGGPRQNTSVLERPALAELRSAWGSVVDSVTLYKAALGGMVGRRWGRFIWVGSALARSMNADDNEADAIASLGMMGLHKVVTGEEAPHNVTANTVLRGGDATDEEVANTVAFLCSEGAGYLSGVTMTIDGGVGSAMF